MAIARTIRDIKKKLNELETLTEDLEDEYYLGITNALREEAKMYLHDVDGTSSEYLRGVKVGQDWLEYEDTEIKL